MDLKSRQHHETLTKNYMVWRNEGARGQGRSSWARRERRSRWKHVVKVETYSQVKGAQSSQGRAVKSKNEPKADVCHRELRRSRRIKDRLEKARSRRRMATKGWEGEERLGNFTTSSTHDHDELNLRRLNSQQRHHYLTSR